MVFSWQQPTKDGPIEARLPAVIASDAPMLFHPPVRVLCSVMVLVVGCAPAADEKPSTIPTGATQLLFSDVTEPFCGADASGCGAAKRPLLSAVDGVAFSADGQRVAVAVSFWKSGLACDIFGCVSIWEQKPLQLCYAVDGAKVTPATDCPAVPSVVAAPDLGLTGPMDGLARDHSVRRAVLGLPNVDARLLTSGGVALGSKWLGTVDAVLESPGAWDLEFANGGTAPHGYTGLVSGIPGSLELLLPTPDGVPFSRGIIPAAEGLFWANQADDVFAVTLDEATLRLEARRVRGAITRPLTRTVGVRELGSEVISAVLTDSNSRVPGVAVPVFELNLLRTPKLNEGGRAFPPFAPFTAHAPSSESVVVCFTQPIATVDASQFSLSGVEVKSASTTTIPQCVRLSTSALPRNATLSLQVKNVSARSGDSITASLSVIAPDVVPVPGAVQVPVPAGVKGVYPLSNDVLLVSTGPEAGLLDLSGVVFDSLATMGPPNSASALFVKPDDGVRGLWVSYQRGLGAGVLSLQTEAGFQELGGVDVVSGGLMSPVGDGTLLVNGNPGPQVVRLSPTMRQSLPRVTGGNFRGVLDVGKVLIEEGGRLQVLTLPDTLELPSFEKPLITTSGGLGRAFTSEGSVYWCANGRLYRLADAGTLDVAPCRELERDAQGVLWASDLSPPSLLRVQGTTTRVVTVKHPYDATKTLFAPHFKGGSVWFDGDTLRLEPSTWRQLAGDAP